MKALGAGAAKLALGLAAVAGLGLGLASPAHAAGSCSSDAECAYKFGAPVGYHYDVSTKAGYRFKALPSEDSHRAGVWNAAQRGNKRGVSFVRLAHQPPTQINLGVDDVRQGGDGNGLTAWTKRHWVVAHNEVVYKRHGWVAEVDSTVDVRLPHHKTRTFYVVATAIWPQGCYCD